jgi:hypothetical protein
MSDEMHILSKQEVDYTDKFLLNRKNRFISRAYRYYAALARRSKSLTKTDYEAIKSDVKHKQMVESS